MSKLEITAVGTLSSHPETPAFLEEVSRVHHRYATEVVAQFSLCPFMTDPKTSFGNFCVIMEKTLDPILAKNAVIHSKNPIIHLIFPCTDVTHKDFEKFRATMVDLLKKSMKLPPVSANFHPEFSGGMENPHRMVGLLRRAPDPFLQWVPKGMEQGGTVFIGTPIQEFQDPAQKNFSKLKGEKITTILEIIEDIHRDRNKSYQPYLRKILA